MVEPLIRDGDGEEAALLDSLMPEGRFRRAAMLYSVPALAFLFKATADQVVERARILQVPLKPIREPWQ